MTQSPPCPIFGQTVPIRHRTRRRGSLPGSLFVLLAAWACLGSPSNSRAADPKMGTDFFETKIRPVLAEHCYTCHSGKAAKPKGGLKLDSIDAIRAGGNSGAIIEPGKPEESVLVQAVAYSGEVAKMPPKTRLSDAVIGDFRKWVQGGAPMPAEAHGAVKLEKGPVAKAGKPGDWWSLKPIVRPSPPAIVAAELHPARTPIDAFISAGLRAKGLAMAPEADRRTLIRRLSFDLTGLPPTPREVADFVADPSPIAYETLVDRLLESPHFGERQARHWMDLVHFAETHGHDQDRIRPNAWPYRDYLIDSFNRDTPFARFVQEQIAADILFPDEPRLTVALGMIAAGPWDESSLRDIRDDSIDRQIGYYLDRDDMVATVISTFDSTTIHCARCHDHKFDPIPQKDYYALQAVFAGVDKAERSYEVDAKLAALRKSLEARRQALRAKDPATLATLLSPEIQSSVNAWEEEQKAGGAKWTILPPAEASSAKGCTLTPMPDHSVASSGKKPMQDTYTVRSPLPGQSVTAIRLEVLPDDRLPAHGPGRNDNGNLHLTEFEVWVGSAADPKAARRIKIARAVADFDQGGWEIPAAIDGNTSTAWGIYPEVGKPHEAVFELAEETTLKPGEVFSIKLVQTSPPGHLIGRFRLSATSSNRPAQYFPIGPEVRAILTIPADRRTADQKKTLAAHHLAQALDVQIAELPPRQFVFAAAAEFAPDASHKPPGAPRPVFVLKRGDINQPTTPAEPGTLSCISNLPSRFKIADPKDEGSRRADLARWVSDPRNPLTWRSIANRVWQSHFGRGLVDTPNDFGRMGSTPTHPELLDWLASELLENGGSLKRLHRLIVSSAAYRQAVVHDARAESIDADNRLLWRQNRRRLDAESVRDAILEVSGRLDETMKGPSVQQFSLSPGVHVTPVVDYTAYSWDSPGAGRRGVYRFLFRTLPDPFMDTLDGADASQLVAARSESITPLQALALLNNPFVLRNAEHLAERLDGMKKVDLAGKIRAAYELAYNRQPDDAELIEWSEYASKFGLANFARILFNSNEFLFVN